MDSLNVKIKFTLASSLSKAANGGINTHTNGITKDVNFELGTANTEQANLYYSATRTLAASATENLDLSGVLTTPFGDTITAAEVVAIYVSANSANTNDVVVGGAGTNGFVGPMGATGTYAVKSGEWVAFTSSKGWAVTAGTGDLLKMTNSAAGSSVTYTIIIVARTVAA